MKKSFLKSITNSTIALCLLVAFTTSCSSDDNEDPDIIFTNLTANKTYEYVDKPISLNIEGSGYDYISVTSTNPLVTITKTASSTYEIAATKTMTANVKVELSNNSKTGTKNISLRFCEHGVITNNTVDGIKVDVDKTVTVLALLGEPNDKINSSDNLSEIWRYPSKGLALQIIKQTLIVNEIYLYSSYYFINNSDNTKTYYTNYPYEIGNAWLINDNATTMDMVRNTLGTPTKGSATSDTTLNVYYQYPTQNIVFNFFSDTEDNYTGKKIIKFTVY